MSGVSRMSGTPWHVTALSSGEEGRRDKRRCNFFDKKSGNCMCKVAGKYLRHCISSTRCDRYEEVEKYNNDKEIINIEQENVKLNNTIYKTFVKRNICVGDNVDIESLDGEIKKTFKILDKNSNGKYNEITNVCLGKNLKETIIYKNKEYRITKIERIKNKNY